MSIPKYVSAWFKTKNWTLHPFQKKMFSFFAKNEDVLLIAPTGGGKTLASFLPALVDINAHPSKGLHTLYLSPLKALTTDIKRNLMNPINEMGLNISIDIRTGDTNSYRRRLQRTKPPCILLTTPESLMLMLSYPESATLFKTLRVVIVDELHQLISSKRGDLTALALAQLNQYAPKAMRIGLSATVAFPDEYAAWLGKNDRTSKIIMAQSTLKPEVHLLTSDARIPYSGFMARYAVPDIYQIIKQHQMTLVFVNTRAQAEFMFRQLWQINEDHLPIAIYHGSLNKAQRLKTESLTVAGQLKAIIATSALELGIDWGNVDCVIQVGAPKGVSRLLQRIGRSNHRFDVSSVAKLVPSNCFEVLECSAAIDAIHQGKLDGETLKNGALDVAIQFILNCACSQPITKLQMLKTIRSAYPYRHLKKEIFLQLFQFTIDGGYTLKHYAQYHRLAQNGKGKFTVVSDQIIKRHRQNIGTIVESARLHVKLCFRRRSKILGDIEEAFAQQLSIGDTFLFGGEILEFIGVRDMFLEAKRATAKESKLPSYMGGAMPLSTYLANGVRDLISNSQRWQNLPQKIQEWLALQKKFSTLPDAKHLLIETFPYKKIFYIVIYTFEGRQANHTLGMLLTKRMESMRLKPIAFTATDYGLAISSLREVKNEDAHYLFEEAVLWDEFEEWLQHSPSLKRTFRQVAIIAGLTERQLAGKRKTMKQVTFSTDLLYDVLLRYEPAHILLAITRADVTNTLLQLDRLTDLLKHFKNHFIYRKLPKPSPFAAPILTTFKSERLQGEAVYELLTHAEIEAETCALIEEVRKRV